MTDDEKAKACAGAFNTLASLASYIPYKCPYCQAPIENWWGSFEEGKGGEALEICQSCGEGFNVIKRVVESYEVTKRNEAQELDVIAAENNNDGFGRGEEVGAAEWDHEESCDCEKCEDANGPGHSGDES